MNTVSQLRETFIDAACVLLCVATGDLIVLPTRTVRHDPRSFAVAGPLQSLGRQRGTRYQHHYATMNSLPCHFVVS